MCCSHIHIINFKHLSVKDVLSYHTKSSETMAEDSYHSPGQSLRALYAAFYAMFLKIIRNIQIFFILVHDGLIHEHVRILGIIIPVGHQHRGSFVCTKASMPPSMHT